ncbi:hypothetical protein [Bifidobacterium sp.]|uniref:hypothetical protein n=2 Tax=Bifidobacterium sp. TaxID=41200 RepID=UPI0039E80FF9
MIDPSTNDGASDRDDERSDKSDCGSQGTPDSTSEHASGSGMKPQKGHGSSENDGAAENDGSAENDGAQGMRSGQDKARNKARDDAEESVSQHDGGLSDKANDTSVDALSDEEIDAAFASFEEDFSKGSDADLTFLNDDSMHPAGTHRGGHPGDDAALNGSVRDSSDSGDGGGQGGAGNSNDGAGAAGAADAGAAGANGSDNVSGSSPDGLSDDELDLDADFQNELEGLIGDRVKIAVIITRISSAELLAAFCQISDISARCIDSSEGAVAVLNTHDADGPQNAAQDLTDVVSGLSVVLAVNKANKLEAKLWMRGQSGEEFAPPILFASSAPFVEDLMIGTVSVDSLKNNGITVVNSDDLDHDRAMGIIARHMRLGPDSSSDETGE